MGYAMWGIAMPNFWLALMLIVLFSVKLGWLPAIGYASPLESPLKFLQHGFLPAIVLGTDLAASLTRYVRAEMLEQIKQDYVRTARAKGLPRGSCSSGTLSRTRWSRRLRSSAPDRAPLGRIYDHRDGISWPASGSLLLEGIYSRDYPIVQGSVLIIAVTYVGINLIVDVFYKWLDPRIQLE